MPSHEAPSLSDPSQACRDSSYARRSLDVFPGGSNGEFNLPPEMATVLARGEGCRVWAADGQSFYDFSMGWGSVLVGHARPEIVEAVARQAALGSNFSYVTEQSLRLAETIVQLSPACERLRFCASGTEATDYCLRLARAFTGRKKVLKFEGAYHGANPVGVTSLFPTAPPNYPHPDPTSAGIGSSETVLISAFNDLARTSQILAKHGHEIAAVIVEPLQRCVPPVDGFLEGLRAATAERGILLIFDEVVTGFRLAYGGAQEYYGIVPDLVAYGKALGGGYPIGSYGGRADIMELVREDRLGDAPYVWTASTLGGNPVSCAAALAALGVFAQTGTYDHLHQLGNYLREGMRTVLFEAGIEAQVIGDGPLAQVVFSPRPVRDYRTSQSDDKQTARKVMLELFRRGIFLNPMGTKLYLSLAHDEPVCDEFLNRFADVLSMTGN
ncbi:MAG: aspartate aminotransferase family protein [Pirellulales bacterium]